MSVDTHAFYIPLHVYYYYLQHHYYNNYLFSHLCYTYSYARPPKGQGNWGNLPAWGLPATLTKEIKIP